MSKLRFSGVVCVVALLLVSAGSAAKAEKWGAKWASPIWTGFYIGGGLGIQKLDGDFDFDSKNKIRHGDFPCGKKYDPAKYTHYAFMYECVKRAHTVYKKPHYGYYDISHSGDLDGDWKLFGTVMLGYDRQVSNHFVLGAFVDADFGKADADFSFSNTSYVAKYGNYPVTTNVSGELEKDFSFTLGLRAGYLIRPQFLAYVLAGYTYASVDGVLDIHASQYTRKKTSVGYPHTQHFAGTHEFSDNLHGFTVGIGGERQFSNRWSARLEYRYTWLEGLKHNFSDMYLADDAKLSKYGNKVWAKSIMTDGGLDIDPNIHSVRFVVSYKFNGD